MECFSQDIEFVDIKQEHLEPDAEEYVSRHYYSNFAMNLRIVLLAISSF